MRRVSILVFFLLLAAMGGCTDARDAPDVPTVFRPPDDADASEADASEPDPPASIDAQADTTHEFSNDDHPDPPDDLEGPAPGPVRTGSFDAAAVPGASGLAASLHVPGHLYLVDDAAGTNEVWMSGRNGGSPSRVRLEGVSAVNLEALDVAPCDIAPGSCVYVGDLGDNVRGRDHVVVYRFPEPDLPSEPSDGSVPVVTVTPDTAVVRYPDGPVDAEALMVGPGEVLYVLSKPGREDVAPPVLYRSPFADSSWEEIGAVGLPDPGRPLQSLFVGNVVTGASRHPGSGAILLRTYDTVFLAAPPSEGASPDGLPTWPLVEVAAPVLPQPEAIAWAADDCGYYTVSEGVGDIWFVPCGGDLTDQAGTDAG